MPTLRNRDYDDKRPNAYNRPRDCKTSALRRVSEFTKFHPPYEQLPDGPVDYFIGARADRDNRKSTIDLILDDGCW